MDEDGTVQAVLSGCFATTHNSSGAIIAAQANRVLTFNHPIDSEEKIPLKFTSVTAAAPGLREWMNMSLTNRPSAKIEATAGDLHCRMTANAGQSLELMTESTEIWASAHFSSPTPHDPEFWLDKLTWLSHLISLCAGRMHIFTEFELDTAEDSASLWAPTVDPATEVESPMKWPLVLPFDPAASSAIIQRWYVARPKVRTLSNMFIEGWIRPTSIIEYRFISLLQGLESYHRQAFSSQDKYLTNDEYEAIRIQITAAIPKAIDPDLKTSLETRLKFGNEHSLRRRLKMLLRHHASATSTLMKAFGQKTDIWIEKVVGLRNELTHNSGSWKQFDSEYPYIHARCLEVELLCWYLLLYEALDNEEDALRAIRRTDEFRQIDHLRGRTGIDWSTPLEVPATSDDAASSERHGADHTHHSRPRESPLPSGLGKTLMHEFNLKPGPKIGELRRLLTEMCERGDVDSRRDTCYYVDVVRSLGLLETDSPPDKEDGSKLH